MALLAKYRRRLNLRSTLFATQAADRVIALVRRFYDLIHRLPKAADHKGPDQSHAAA
jgi:hypothetical protein